MALDFPFRSLGQILRLCALPHLARGYGKQAGAGLALSSGTSRVASGQSCGEWNGDAYTQDCP